MGTSSRGAGRYSTPDCAVGGDDDDDGDGEVQGVVMWETNGDNEVVVSRHRWPSQLGRLGGAMGSADGAAPHPPPQVTKEQHGSNGTNRASARVPQKAPLRPHFARRTAMARGTYYKKYGPQPHSGHG